MIILLCRADLGEVDIIIGGADEADIDQLPCSSVFINS